MVWQDILFNPLRTSMFGMMIIGGGMIISSYFDTRNKQKRFKELKVKVEEAKNEWKKELYELERNRTILY